MALIHNIQLAIPVDRARGTATVDVECDVVFSEYEVNEMNVLGLRYSLDCHLMNMTMLYPDAVVRFEGQSLPHDRGAASTHEHVRFSTTAATRDLHEYVFGKDPIMAQLVLTNLESGAQLIEHSEVLAVDLAA